MEEKQQTAEDEFETLRADAMALPHVPPPTVILRTLAVVIWVAIAYALLRGASVLILDYWLMESLGLESIFWTNVFAGAALFAVAGVAFAAAVYLPLRAYAVTPTVRRFGAYVAVWAGLVAGWTLAGHYQEFLLAFSGGSFGVSDSTFGHDVSFYAFVLPALWTTLWWVTALAGTGLVATLVAQTDRLRSERALWGQNTVIPERVGRLATPAVQALVGALGLLFAIEIYLARYELLWKDNAESGVRMGVEYLDVVPFFSTVNAIHVTALVTLGITALTVYRLRDMHVYYAPARARGASAADGGEDRPEPRSNGGEGSEARKRGSRSRRRRMVAVAMAALIVLDLAFFAGVVATDHVAVQPNEPRVQESFIQEHMDATLAGWGVEDVEVVEWETPAEPHDTETLLSSNTFQRAPIWPGWVSYLEAPVDLQHVERLQKTGTTMVYGPTFEVYQQEQQLRPYYDFASVDPVRYTVDGEKRMFTSAVRELPSVEAIGPQLWLDHWATNRFLYTHGFGLVMSPADQLKPNGNLMYAVEGIPPRAQHPELESEPRIYYGEMLRHDEYFNYVFTNAQHLSEFDFAEAQSRREFTYPENAGVPMDGYLKRAIFGLAAQDFWKLMFTDFIDHDSTHVHYYREPIERISKIAPFLFVDTNIYAVAADGRTKWMVNALTTTKRYPNSFREEFGDKAQERSVDPVPTRMTNYVEDSVKITMDATTGEVTFYKFADEPIVNAWANVYPDLFTPRSEMSASVEAHLQYPLQLAHTQWDDIYKRYHQRDLLEFYNSEDLWDDADEVKGSIIGNRDEIVFSYEPIDLLIDPADLPGDVGLPAGNPQFAKMMPFTAESTRNMRSMMLVFQDPESYGQMVSLRVPQGELVYGPEQADALVDEDPDVTQQIGWWQRQGAEVIRGHTLILPVAGDVIYLEPIFVKSQQNELPHIQLFAAVYHEDVAYARTPDGAIRALGEELSLADTTTTPANATAASPTNTTAAPPTSAIAAPGGELP